MTDEHKRKIMELWAKYKVTGPTLVQLAEQVKAAGNNTQKGGKV